MCFWNCRVTVFRPSPLQWICREWVWKLGSNKATACSEEGKTYRIRRPKGPRKKGTLAQGLESLTPLASQGPLSFSLGSFSFFHPPFSVRSLLWYILLLHSSSFYTCRSSILILECTSHRPLFLALCELLWPPSRCPRVISTSTGLRC